MNLRRALHSLLAVAFFVAMPASSWCSAQEPATLEYQIKASLILNFIRFTEWPPEAMSSDKLHICLVGKDDFGTAFAAIERQIVHGQQLAIERISSVQSETLRSCQVVFFGGESSATFEKSSPALRGLSALTIGESGNFLEQGGMISMLVEGDKIVFDVNRQATVAARLNVSSRLLRVARRVND